MYWGVVLFETLCWVGFATLFLTAGVVSFRQHRVHPSVYAAVSILSVSWMESPYDNVMYAVFHPDFHRLPKFGPIGLTQGGLPLIAPPGYVVYFLVPALIGIVIANRGHRTRGWRLPQALLTCGLASGIVWDGVIETGQANTLHLWTFARTAPGLTLFAGSRGQVPVTCYVAMGTFIMGMAYLVGRRGADGRGLIDGWASRHTPNKTARVLVSGLGYIVTAQVLYFITLVPHGVVKLSGMMTQGLSGTGIPYPGRIAPQHVTGGVQTNGALGTVVLVVLLVGFVGLIYGLVRRFDPEWRSAPTDTAAPTPTSELQPAS